MRLVLVGLAAIGPIAGGCVQPAPEKKPQIRTHREDFSEVETLIADTLVVLDMTNAAIDFGLDEHSPVEVAYVFPDAGSTVVIEVVGKGAEAKRKVILHDKGGIRDLTEKLPWKEALENAFELAGRASSWENSTTLRVWSRKDQENK